MSWIGALGSIASGILGRSKKVSALQNSYDAIRGQALGARKASEEAGFNPLTLLGVSSAVGPSEFSNAYLGNSIADAAMQAADALAKQKNNGLLEGLAAENAKLKEEVQQMTIRPKVGGIYSGTHMTPSVRQALGVAPAPLYDSTGNGGGYADVRGQGGSGSVGAQVGAGVSGLDAVAPEQTNTFKNFQNDGQSTDVPLGPDIDEVVTGALIAANNKRKAREAFRARDDMTFGKRFGAGEEPWTLLPPRDDTPYIERDRLRSEVRGKKPKANPKLADKPKIRRFHPSWHF